MQTYVATLPFLTQNSLNIKNINKIWHTLTHHQSTVSNSQSQSNTFNNSVYKRSQCVGLGLRISGVKCCNCPQTGWHSSEARQICVNDVWGYQISPHLHIQPGLTELKYQWILAILLYRPPETGITGFPIPDDLLY